MPKRAAELPDVPAIAQTLPGYEMSSWAGLMLPAGTPQQAGDTLQKAVVAALTDAGTARRLRDLALVPVASGPAELAEHCRKDIDKFARIIQAIGMPMQ
jgi:tripartite-type tricarboxylate transporter receptor subunit TctC